MGKPRDLSTTLPSPSEMENYEKCPCLWWLKDRLWVKPNTDIVALKFGRAIDTVFNGLFRKEILVSDMLPSFDKMMEMSADKSDEFAAFGQATRDALAVWITVYGRDVEDIVHVQPKLPISRGKVDYSVRMAPGLVRIRERKLISPYADIDDEIAKYQLGWQPLAYAADYEQTFGETVDCVEMEFLIRSAPAKGRYKAIPASTRREPIYVDDWKKAMWRSSSVWDNHTMQIMEAAMTADVPFHEIPRHTQNCLKKLGQKTYECDFYKACKTNTNPVMMEEHFHQDKQE